MEKTNKIFAFTSITLLISSYALHSLYESKLFEGILYGVLISYINILSTQLIGKFFIKAKKSKTFIFLFTILKIMLLAGIVIFLVSNLLVDLIGFLIGFSVILIVFILLNQGK